MNHMDKGISTTGSARRLSLALAGVLVAAMALLGSIGATTATAGSWETAKTFAPLVPTPPNPPTWPEDVQLGGVSGMAVNMTGAGGVSPGTIYTVGDTVGTPWNVARYSTEGTFELAWTAVERCGPKTVPPTTCPPVPTGASGGIDVAVDQATGNVYVFWANQEPDVVREYRADGTGPIAEFGETDPSGTIATSPEKLHGSPGLESIAVDNTGKVYIYDRASLSNKFQRLMAFRPQTPGDYEHYVYAGQASDVGGGFLPTHAPSRPMVDDAGNVYVSGESYVEKYNPAEPATPVCTFNLPAGGITSATVNPETGAVFYYSFKDGLIHQLSPCNAQGQFVEDALANPPFPPAPKRGFIEAMAFNPLAQLPGHSPGVLYAGTPLACPPVGSCPAEAKGQSSLGYMFALQISHEPIVVSESVTQVGITSAILNAQVNPQGTQTTFAFQYLTDAAYQANDPSDRFAGAREAPVGGALLGNGQQPLLATAAVGGLSPATAYRYRVVATSSEGTVVGTPAQFQTRAAEGEGLPDGRAYELVSPVEKNGGEVLPGAPEVASCGSECKPGLSAKRFAVAVSPSGESIGYQGQPFLLNEGAVEYDEYVSNRSASGWQTASMSPPLVANASGLIFEAFAFDGGLSRALTFATNESLAPEAPASYRNIFSQPTNDRFDLAPVLRVTPPDRPAVGAEGFEIKYVGSTSDLSRVFFEANDALTGPGGTAPAAIDGGPGKFNLYEWHAGQLSLVNVQPLNASTSPGAAFGSGLQLALPSQERDDYSNAIAANGALVFWSSEGGQVYVRENGESTREIPDHTGKFLTAAADGSKVLLNDGVLYNLQTETLTNLTGGSGGFEGIAGQSEGLDTVYFVANTVLTETPNGQGVIAKAGGKNLYVWQKGSVSFVASLLSSDNEGLHGWIASPVLRTAEASPDGRWLAFNSTAALTGANTTGACLFDPSLQKWVGSTPCQEVYLYDSATGSLLCPSCNPTGAAPLGGSFLRLMTNAAGSLSQPRYLTSNGRLYFDTRDELSPLDTNGQVEDVYQYEPAGTGSCAQAGGCVALLTSGRGAYDSNFLATDLAGDNVFFTTRQQLVPRDQDALIDLYDARVGGGIAADYAALPPECLGEGCQPSAVSPPSELSASSATLEGSGNVKPKEHHKKKHHKKKHHKKKHHKKKSGKAQRHHNGKKSKPKESRVKSERPGGLK
jgi:hypothetical protein